MVMNCLCRRSGQALTTASVRLTLQLPALQHRPSSTLSALARSSHSHPQCPSSASPPAPPAHPHSPVSRSHRASSVSTRPELSASPASSVPTNTTLTTRRASRSSPPGESLHNPYTCYTVTFRPPRDHRTRPIASDSPLPHTPLRSPVLANC
jgi:hypothetical protein